MNVSRRFFIGGAFGFLAGTPGLAFLSKPGLYAAGKPILSFGMLSDIHIRLVKRGKCFLSGYDTDTFKTALTYFRDQGADAVSIAGDMAHSGVVEELLAVAKTWNEVFPNDKAPDGRHVERLFTTGNHDWNGMRRGSGAFADEAERRLHAIELDPARHWDAAFHEEWREVSVREVKGVPFVLAQWCKGDCNGRSETFNAHLADFYAQKRFDPAAFFFHIQHPHPRGTVHGESVWGQDDGTSVKTLSAYANAIAFSGHSHTSLTDERAVWQGAFTSLGCASLRNVSTSMPGFTSVEGESHVLTDLPFGENRRSCRQGQFVRVFDDRVVVSRREFTTGASLGPDLVIPRSSDRPFAFAARKKSARAPEFPKDAKASAVKTTCKVLAAKKKPEHTIEAYELTVPAVAKTGVRAATYAVDVRAADGTRKSLGSFMVPGFRFPAEDTRAYAPVRLAIDAAQVPAAPFTFEVRPVSCWGVSGQALTI